MQTSSVNKIVLIKDWMAICVCYKFFGEGVWVRIVVVSQ